mmetsp:Transcript_77601/g.208116  ORF Transcript_77601/g.208116 Transcript_77601/m.208116 type:complete len:201 (+) Transcript_77601:1-603(+)
MGYRHAGTLRPPLLEARGSRGADAGIDGHPVVAGPGPAAPARASRPVISRPAPSRAAGPEQRHLWAPRRSAREWRRTPGASVRAHRRGRLLGLGLARLGGLRLRRLCRGRLLLLGGEARGEVCPPVRDGRGGALLGLLRRRFLGSLGLPRVDHLDQGGELRQVELARAIGVHQLEGLLHLVRRHVLTHDGHGLREAVLGH